MKTSGLERMVRPGPESGVEGGEVAGFEHIQNQLDKNDTIIVIPPIDVTPKHNSIPLPQYRALDQAYTPLSVSYSASRMALDTPTDKLSLLSTWAGEDFGSAANIYKSPI